VQALVHLGRQHNVVAAGERLDRLSDNRLRRSEAVDVGGVPEGDAELERLPEERRRALMVKRPGLPGTVAVAHTAQRDPADLEA